MKQSLAKLVILGFLSLSPANVMAAGGLPITIALPELPADQEMLVLEINLEPGGQGSPPHQHNAHVFVYVLEGTVNMQVAGEKMVTLS